MKTELTPEVLEAEIRLLNLHQQRLHDWANSIREQISQKDKKRLSLLTKQEEQFKPCGEGENICNCKSESECGYLEQPQANDVGKFPKSTWEIDALRRKVKRFEEEIQSLKQANAELLNELSVFVIVAKNLGWNEATTGRNLLLDSAEKLIEKYIKQ